MRGLAEQNFYEILEVASDAPLQEIERAYRITRSTYEPHSLATYSVFSDDQSELILARVEEAYSVLSDARLRREYDARLRREGIEPSSRNREPEPARATAASHAPSNTDGGVESRAAVRPPALTAGPAKATANAAANATVTWSSGGAAAEPLPREPVPPPRPARPQDALDLDEELEPEDGVFDGPVLRRVRISRGVELAEISAWSKVSELHLRFIEANRFDDLPAMVYVRGFLKEYARYLRLDPDRVAESYLGRMKERVG